MSSLLCSHGIEWHFKNDSAGNFTVTLGPKRIRGEKYVGSVRESTAVRCTVTKEYTGLQIACRSAMAPTSLAVIRARVCPHVMIAIQWE
jgi:hypothetical protein